MAASRLPIHDRMAELAEPVRSRVLAVLEAEELTVGELASALQLPQSTVSRHLQILAAQGWIVPRTEGTSRWYRQNLNLNAEMRSLWLLVRESFVGTAGALQDRARVEAVLAARRNTSHTFFEAAADNWDALRAELFGVRADLQAVLALLDTSIVVGDLGCGTGQLSWALAPHVGYVHAIDESPAMLAAANARLASFSNVHVNRGSLEHLPLDYAALDVAVLSLVLHHVVDPVLALREVHRVLRPAGKILIADMRPHDNVLYRDTMGHKWLGFSEAQLTQWLLEAGFVSPRYVALPVDSAASGPALFSCTATVMPKPLMIVA